MYLWNLGMNKIISTKMRLAFTLIGISCLVSLCGMGPSKGSDPRNKAWDLALDPHRVVGVDACSKCHANEINVWKQTPHSETFLTLHRKPKAQEIASKLGIESFKTDSNCVQCHYTMKQDGSKLDAISGVSCESCHGAAQNWLALHNDYGGPNATKTQESPDHRIQRLTQSIDAGMRNPVNVYLVAKSCYRCHTVPDEKLVNVGGHVAGSLDFEMVSWSQGMVRHNFVRTDGKVNAEESQDRLRVMFVAGMIADMESSMRATAKATEKADFGITSAKRTARAAERLKSIHEKVPNPVLEEILAVYGSVKLKINNAEPLTVAADKISQLGLRFVATTDGQSLAGLDPFVPGKDKWK